MRTPAEIQTEAWNTAHPIGTPVRYWPGVRDGAGRLSKTRSQAWLLGHGTPVVLVDGYSGGIALAHVEPAPPEPAVFVDALGLVPSADERIEVER